MDRLPALEIIAVNGVGLDAIDLAKAKARNIKVTTTPDVLTDDVAEMALGLMLAVARGLCVGDRFVRAGSWPQGKPRLLGRRLAGQRLGLLGMGNIGRAVARRAEALGLSVAYTGRRRHGDLAYDFVADLTALAAGSDILVVTAAATAETRNIVNAEVLNALGPKGVLINVARGSLVDETALVSALAEGRLGGAGLDVFADEPNAPSALFGLDNVVLQPHNGSATVEARQAMGRLILENLDAQFAGRN
jgi:lactate dehydrogenase-like 2-hydroxyacid dehydrogenase